MKDWLVPSVPSRTHAHYFNEWVQTHMNSLIGIQMTNKILQFKDGVYATDTELQRVMSLYEENETDDGPQLKPMVINWKTINRRWNKELFLQFLTYAEDQDHMGGSIENNEENEMREMFYAQIN